MVSTNSCALHNVYSFKAYSENGVKGVPDHITTQIFSLMDYKTLARCLLVNKMWQALASDEGLWKALHPEIAFGKKQWGHYFGDIGEEPPLPKDIYKILKSPCPFWWGKKVEDTHVLVLIPKSVNGNPLTLQTLEELVKAPKKGYASQYCRISNGVVCHSWDEIIEEHGTQAVAEAHWVLMTKDVIPESRNKYYTVQQKVISEIAVKLKIPYEIPNVLDASVCIFMEHAISKKRLFNADNILWTYMRCQEHVKDRYPISIGAFYSDGLDAHSSSIALPSIGMAVLRKFF
jgi:hypothetical protein